MEVLWILIIPVLWYFFIKNRLTRKTTFHFTSDHRKILLLNVEFYRQLNEKEKISFEQCISRFLETTKITGVDIDVDDGDRILVAASAVIPVFSFPGWEYINLKEVLLYPAAFNESFESGTGGQIQGMVGTGYMEGKMILSKPALVAGFRNGEDKKNVGIHEFVHLIDKADDNIDGIPEVLLQKQYAIPWIDMVQKEMDRIHNAESEINTYGGVNKAEFFAVISEYFFERPKMLKTKHPELYSKLEKIFTVDLSSKYKKKKSSREPGRNDPCICGSGRKYKHCCGK